jgi:hypothetical protein
MASVKGASNVQPTDKAVRGLIIVSRDQPDLWEALTQEFGRSEEIQVILDRRQGERRKEERLGATDRRGADRRSISRIEDDLRFRQYVLVRPHYRTPRD